MLNLHSFLWNKTWNFSFQIAEEGMGGLSKCGGFGPHNWKLTVHLSLVRSQTWVLTVAAEIEAQTTRPSTTVHGATASTPSGVHAAACPQAPREKTSLQFCKYSKELNLFLKFQTMTWNELLEPQHKPTGITGKLQGVVWSPLKTGARAPHATCSNWFWFKPEANSLQSQFLSSCLELETSPTCYFDPG